MLFTFSGKQKKIQGLSAGKYYFDNEGGGLLYQGPAAPSIKKHTYIHGNTNPVPNAFFVGKNRL